MDANVDTLVYQLEDDDPAVRTETLQRLRRIAAVERTHFPVRNPRRFLHCVRRRILDDDPRIAREALRLVADITPALGDDVDQILSSILPHLVPSLATRYHARPSGLRALKTLEVSTPSPIDDDGRDGVDTVDSVGAPSVTLHDETFEVFRKFVVVSNDLKAVAELLASTGLSHTSAAVREASVLATIRLLEDRYARKAMRGTNRVSRMDKALFVGLFQSLVPVLEDDDEHVVVAAEEALAKLHLYWGDGVDDAMAFLSAEDRRTLRAHQEPIDEFLHASTLGVASSSSSSSLSAHTVAMTDCPSSIDRPLSSSSSSSDTPTRLAFGFLPLETLDALQTSTSNSNADWKRRSAAVETLVRKLEQATPAALQRSSSNANALVDIVVRLLQDADAHLVKRAVEILQLWFRKLEGCGLTDRVGTTTSNDDGDAAVGSPSSSSSAARYALKALPHLVETAASFADDSEMEIRIYALITQVFASSTISNVVHASQVLVGAMQHRRLELREEALRVWIALLLSTSREHDRELAAAVLTHDTLQVLGQLLGDSSTRVRAMAVEAVAVLAAVTARPDIARLIEASLDDFAADRADLDALRRRLRQPHLSVLLDSGCVSFVSSSKSTSSTGRTTGTTAVRSSTSAVGSHANATANSSSVRSNTGSVTEQSLSSASELRMLASSEHATESPTRVRASRSAQLSSSSSSPTASTRNSVAATSSSTSLNATQAAAASSTANLVAQGSGGSMSDRSYFRADSSSSSNSNSANEPVADKLAMLKRKATQLRKSSSTKQIVRDSAAAAVSRTVSYDSGRNCKASLAVADVTDDRSNSSSSSTNQRMQSHTSPQRSVDRVELLDSDTVESPVLTGQRQRRDDTAPAAALTRKSVQTTVSGPTTSQLATPEPLTSPQKLQMLQSSRATSDADRPIVSKYALASRSRDDAALDDDDDDVDSLDSGAAPLESCRQQQQPSRQQTQTLPSRYESPRRGDDRRTAAKTQSPVRASSSNTSAATGSNDAADVVPARVHPVASPAPALRQRVGDISEVPLARSTGIDDAALAAVEDTYVPSGKAPAAGRPISLATRKRLEAKSKQESSSVVTGGRSDSSPANDVAATASSVLPTASEIVRPSALQKKSSLAAMARATGSPSNSSDDKPVRAPGAFGKQEPRYLDVHELMPVANPKQETAKLLDRVRGTDWEDTFEALSIVRRLARHHPAFLSDKIHAVTKDVLAQVLNLRSAVSKNALLALESMCAAFERAMDPEVDAVVAVLIKRSADSNTFVCESATAAINAVILHCSASKVVSALAPHLSSKAVPLRREVARAMHTLVVSMADSVQSSRDLPAILAIVGRCLEDSNNEVRDAAKQTVLYLYYEQRIDAERLKKAVPASARSKVEQLLSGTTRYTPATVKAPVVATVAKSVAAAAAQSSKAKLLTEAAASKSSVTAAAPPAAAVSSTRAGSSSSSNSAPTIGSSALPPRKAPASAAVDTSALETLQKRLESSNWKDRFDALQETTAFVSSNGVARALAESGKITALFDALLKRMDDGNAKVNVSALECLEQIVPAFGNDLELVLSSFVPALAKNLAANNPKLAALSLDVVRLVCDHVDARLLCQHFAAVARHANSRVKPLLIDALDELAAKRDEKNQYALNRYVLPLAFELVKEAKSDVKDANARLLRSLYATLGPAMLSAVYKQSTAQQDKIASILGISSFAKS